MTKSRTRQAYEWLVAHPDYSQNTVSSMFGLNQSTLSRAVKTWSRPVCPTCGHYLKESAK